MNFVKDLYPCLYIKVISIWCGLHAFKPKYL